MWHILVLAHSVLHSVLATPILLHYGMENFRYYNTKTCCMCPKCFLKIAGKSNNCQFYLADFLNLEQVNSWKSLWKFWNGPLCRNKSGPFLLLDVATYWKSNNSEACVKKLYQILANNIENGGEGDWSQNLCEVLWVLFSLGICSNYSVTNYVKIPHWIFKNCKY